MPELEQLKSQIEAYSSEHPEESQYKAQMLDLIARRPDCLLRSCLEGHFTASAFVLHPNLPQVLLIHHRKLDKWLQPGGHADGDANMLRVAQREVLEETGIVSQPLRSGIFDIDIHEIPEKGVVPAHLHYDLRFLLLGDSAETQIEAREVLDISWVNLKEIDQFTKENSILRMTNKALAAIEAGDL